MGTSASQSRFMEPVASAKDESNPLRTTLRNKTACEYHGMLWNYLYVMEVVMDDVWVHLNYAGKCGEDGFPLPGDLIRQNRIQLNMSQEQLACKLGCSRAMVARMENENLGMNDIM